MSTTITRSRGLRKGTLPIGEFQVPFAVAGAGHRVLVCVNGMQQTMAMWRTIVKRMTGTGHRVVLFDFPHQGRAVASTGIGSLTLLEQVDILRAIVAHVSPSAPVALLGGSWGALVAAAFAARHPERVRRLVLGGFDTKPNAKLQEIARRGQALINGGRGHELAALFVSEFGGSVKSGTRAALDAQFSRLRPEQLRQMYDSGVLLVEAVDLETIVDLGRIAAPTLIVNGDADPLVDAAETAHVAARFRCAAFHVEPGAGHFLHFERPAIVETYAGFLLADDAVVRRQSAAGPTRSASGGGRGPWPSTASAAQGAPRAGSGRPGVQESPAAHS